MAIISGDDRFGGGEVSLYVWHVAIHINQHQVAMRHIKVIMLVLGLLISSAIQANAQSNEPVKKRLVKKTEVFDNSTSTYTYNYDNAGHLISMDSSDGDKLTIDWSTYPDSVIIAAKNGRYGYTSYTTLISVNNDYIMVKRLGNEIVGLSSINFRDNKIGDITPIREFMGLRCQRFESYKNLYGMRLYYWKGSVINNISIRRPESKWYIYNRFNGIPNRGGWFAVNSEGLFFADDVTRIASEAGLLGEAPSTLTAGTLMDIVSSNDKEWVKNCRLNWELDSDGYPMKLNGLWTDYNETEVVQHNFVTTFEWEVFE